MPRVMSEIKADQLLWLAFGAWIINCIQPAIGMMFQFMLIIWCVKSCDVKVIPALMLLMLTRGNLGLLRADYMALRLGFTISPGAMLLISTFFFSIFRIIQGRFDSKTLFWCVLWLVSFIPASIMSFTAKSHNLIGMWSYPIMDALIPGLYFWAVAAGRTYFEGKDYLFKRLMVLIVFVSIFMTGRCIYIFSFFITAIMFAMAYYALKNRIGAGWKGWTMVGAGFALFNLIFGRAIVLQRLEGYVAEADKYGSTFSHMGVVAIAMIFAFLIGKRILGQSILRMLPILIVVANALFVMFVLNTQAGDNAKDINWQAEHMDERVTAKVFGDRAGVWKMGWEEVTTPPYFIKDLREFYVFDSKNGWGMKLLPHNQFITLLGRYGLWLGGTLALWIIFIWIRAMVACRSVSRDDPMRSVYLPVGLAIFAVVGVSGQSVVTGEPWSNALVCVILPGVAYGDMLMRRNLLGQWS